MFGSGHSNDPVPEAPIGPPSLTEAEKVVEWRTGQFSRMGFNELQAEILGRARHVDLRQAETLLAKGCPPSKAALILI